MAVVPDRLNVHQERYQEADQYAEVFDCRHELGALIIGYTGPLVVVATGRATSGNSSGHKDGD